MIPYYGEPALDEAPELALTAENAARSWSTSSMGTGTAYGLVSVMGAFGRRRVTDSTLGCCGATTLGQR